nr:hypothetical protein [Tanacetum cinerariifolium]
FLTEPNNDSPLKLLHSGTIKKSEETPALLAEQTEFLTPLTSHGHEEEQLADPQVLQEQEE